MHQVPLVRDAAGHDPQVHRAGPAGSGNEQDRLALLRSHQDYVTAQIQELTECLHVITHKVTIYEEHLAEGTADCLWVAPSTTKASEAS